jgi:hypothetical protein
MALPISMLLEHTLSEATLAEGINKADTDFFCPSGLSRALKSGPLWGTLSLEQVTTMVTADRHPKCLQFQFTADGWDQEHRKYQFNA